MLAVFFFGYGLSCLGVASASSPPAFAVWLLVLGVASAIYHPVGSTMLVAHARRPVLVLEASTTPAATRVARNGRAQLVIVRPARSGSRRPTRW